MIDVYRDNCTNQTKSYQGIVELLNELKSRKLKLGVFSNKADALTKEITKAFISRCF